MAIETDDDLTDFFALDDFGTAAKFTASGKRTKLINGIFDNPHASKNATDHVDITMPKPQFTCRTVDVPGVADGDLMIINDVEYYIRVNLNDGLGVTTLLLEKK